MRVCGVGCCAKWKNEKAVVQGLEPQGKAVKKVTKNPLNIGVTKFRAQNPPCETQICNPHSHTLGPFPMFPDRYIVTQNLHLHPQVSNLNFGYFVPHSTAGFSSSFLISEA